MQTLIVFVDTERPTRLARHRVNMNKPLTEVAVLASRGYGDGPLDAKAMATLASRAPANYSRGARDHRSDYPAPTRAAFEWGRRDSLANSDHASRALAAFTYV